jgi:hypothetical protein
MPGVGDLPPLCHIQGIAAAGSVRRQGGGGQPRWFEVVYSVMRVTCHSSVVGLPYLSEHELQSRRAKSSDAHNPIIALYLRSVFES